MGEFFKGWRRKAGCVTLLMTLVFVTAWLRSVVGLDVVQFPSGRSTMEHCASTDQSLVWGRLRKDDPRQIMAFPVWATSHYESLATFIEQANLRYTSRFCGFGSGELNVDSPARIRHTFWVIPYWSLAIPLVLVTACLFLWPTRRPVKLESADSISKSHATLR